MRGELSNNGIMSVTTIKSEEAAHFGALAADWWDPKGSSAMLHKLNPVRLGYIRAQIDTHFDADSVGFYPLADRRALDVGCGAGLLAEPLARLGAEVMAIDAAPENIAVAKAHAAQHGLSIDYRACGIEALDAGKFDLVTSMEVIEHVADPTAFVAGLVGALADDGLLIMSTPNRTTLSKIAMVDVAEGVGAIPKGTHDWDQFLTPDELTALLEAAGMNVTDVTGLSFSPTRGFVLSDDMKLNYLLSAVRL